MDINSSRRSARSSLQKRLDDNLKTIIENKKRHQEARAQEIEASLEKKLIRYRSRKGRVTSGINVVPVSNLPPARATQSTTSFAPRGTVRRYHYPPTATRVVQGINSELRAPSAPPMQSLLVAHAYEYVPTDNNYHVALLPNEANIQTESTQTDCRSKLVVLICLVFVLVVTVSLWVQYIPHGYLGSNRTRVISLCLLPN
jgi:hypothetical protein